MIESVSITTAVTSYLGVVTSLITTIFSNANLMLFVAAAIVSIALGTVKRLIGRM